MRIFCIAHFVAQCFQRFICSFIINLLGIPRYHRSFDEILLWCLRDLKHSWKHEYIHLFSKIALLPFPALLDIVLLYHVRVRHQLVGTAQTGPIDITVTTLRLRHLRPYTHVFPIRLQYCCLRRKNLGTFYTSDKILIQQQSATEANFKCSQEIFQ